MASVVILQTKRLLAERQTLSIIDKVFCIIIIAGTAFLLVFFFLMMFREARPLFQEILRSFGGE